MIRRDLELLFKQQPRKLWAQLFGKLLEKTEQECATILGKDLPTEPPFAIQLQGIDKAATDEDIVEFFKDGAPHCTYFFTVLCLCLLLVGSFYYTSFTAICCIDLHLFFSLTLSSPADHHTFTLTCTNSRLVVLLPDDQSWNVTSRWECLYRLRRTSAGQVM